MKRKYFFIFLSIIIFFFLSCKNSLPQNKKEYNIFTLSENSSSLIIPELNEIVSDAMILQINESELQRLCSNRDVEISLSFPYGQQNTVRLNLSRFDILVPDAKIISRTSAGNEETVLNENVLSYSGNIEGLENTFIIINFTRDNIIGLMSSGGENYVLGKVQHSSDIYILYKESNLKIKSAFHCGTGEETFTEDIEKMRKMIDEQMNDSPTDLYIANIAIDIDFATYNIYGSTQAAANYALALMAGVSAIYMKEVNVKLAVSYLRVWTVPDPYTGTTSLAILNQFRNEWSTNQQSVERTLAHLISRRSGNLGGIAYINVLCNNASGYSFSNINGVLIPLPVYSWDVEVIAHETGHNFASNHTHNCAWIGGPIDTCYIPEGGCYPGPAIPRIGTIMSYCMENAAVSFILGFGPQPRALIRGRAESAPCITISARPITVAYPNGGEIFNKGKLVQIYWGTNLTGNVNIEFSIDNGSNWQTIQNNFPGSQRKYDWAVPNVSTTNTARVRILNALNLNVGDTSDAAFTIMDSYLNPLNITIGIEGLWDGVSQVPDTVRIYLRNFIPPYGLADSSTAYLNSSGFAAAGFSNTTPGYYFLQIRHRNTIETWSAFAQLFISGIPTNYDFTLTQSYGNNSTFKLGRWCFYSGDIHKDGIVDASDISLVNNAAFNSLAGYTREDVSGDNFVDATDLSYVDNSVRRGVMLIRP